MGQYPTFHFFYCKGIPLPQENHLNLNKTFIHMNLTVSACGPIVSWTQENLLVNNFMAQKIETLAMLLFVIHMCGICMLNLDMLISLQIFKASLVILSSTPENLLN